jgi:hypothetical protein
LEGLVEQEGLVHEGLVQEVLVQEGWCRKGWCRHALGERGADLVGLQAQHALLEVTVVFITKLL